MTRAKICGITNVDDALPAVSAGPDALGFIFAHSPRRVSVDGARDIVAALPTFVISVGIFQNAPLDEVRGVVDDVGLDCVQLHGEESPAYCAVLGRCVIKRFSVSDDDSPADLRDRV